jgi:Rieske Fe-S protein
MASRPAPRTDPDVYPAQTGRRRFVKGVVGGAVLSAGVAGSVTTLDLATDPRGRGGGVRQYLGIELVDGPAPRGMPIVPIRIDDEGFLIGVWPEATETTEGGRTVRTATVDVGGATYSTEWYQYCGVQSIPAIRPGSSQDNFLRYDAGGYEWQQETVQQGDRMHVDDFSDYAEWTNGLGAAGLGKPATGTWRSVDVPGEETLPIQVLRVADRRFERMLAQPTTGRFLEAAAPDGFLAWLNKCTHFCCVPSYKGTEQSITFGAADAVYCPCHQSVYDPFSVVVDQFVALPRPEEG